MSFEPDEEILQDFLVEAGEILEQLSEQLVDLENRVDDVDLLNAIFRGFHTVKGGAGFLQLNPLVELCHIAENVFDYLRNGKLVVNTEIMDVVLQALDSLNEMFDTVNKREEPASAEPSLLKALQNFVDIADGKVESTPDASSASPEISTAPASESSEINDSPAIDTPSEDQSPVESKVENKGENKSASDDNDLFGFDNFNDESPSASSSDEITAEEFEALLDELHCNGSGAEQGAVDSGSESGSSEKSLDSIINSKKEDIDDDEFEVLLDALHGKGKHKGTLAQTKEADPSPTTTSAQLDTNLNQTQAVPNAESGLITDHEFESLLDNLHGKGKGPTPSTVSSVTQKDAAPTEKSAPVTDVKSVTAPKADNNVKPITSAKTESTSASKKSAPSNKEGATMGETTVRVDTKRLDDIMNMVGELVLVRNRLVRLGLKSSDGAMAKAVANLDVVTADLQSSVMKTRMQPIKKVFGRFPRVVRDLARNLKKEITLELQGEDTDLDKNLVEALADPLVHLVRNSVDHGIEKPEAREAVGKPRSGKVVLAAQQEGDHIVLSITDDGGGIDADVLRRKAVEKGIMDEETVERISDHDAYNLIFHPGFSTKEEISDVSGRGVGMDVVKTKITQLNGTIDVQSSKGEGTVIAIKVPLTLAIMPTLMVMLESQTFALPLVSVNEIFHMDLRKTNIVDGQEVVIVREKALPLFYLKRWLVNSENDSTASAHVVVVSVGTQKVGFVVDQLIGQEEVVIKPLGKMLNGTAGMAGATITGDGRIALILDVPSMLRRYAGRIQ